jgi:hypothetical protein
MKHMKRVAMAALLLLAIVGLGTSGAAAQSLGDYARAVRKNKPESNSATRHYDNDNLPTDQTLSVVGPPPSSDAGNAKAPTDLAKAAAERKKTSEEWQKKLDQQKAKIDSLNHELDLDQRELRLRTAAVTADPGIALRNAQWNEDEAKYRSDIEAKQKALDAARQELDDMQEQAHKAGIAVKDNDKDNENESSKDKDKDNEKK